MSSLVQAADSDAATTDSQVTAAAEAAPKFYEGVGFTDPSLASEYENSTGPVVFIDESYRTVKQALHNQSFYIVAGVVVERSRMPVIREKLVEIGGSPLWHTTDENKTADGRDRILKMDRYVARTADAVFALHGRISADDPTAESVRERCLTGLLQTLCQQGVLHPSGLAVYDRRRDSSQQQRDAASIARMRRSGAIHRNLRVYAGRPRSEALLWGADVAAWSLRQVVLRRSDAFFAPFNAAANTQVIKVS